MASSRSVKVTDTKIHIIVFRKCTFYQIIANVMIGVDYNNNLFTSGSVNIGDEKRRLCLSFYSLIFSSPLANNC